MAISDKGIQAEIRKLTAAGSGAFELRDDGDRGSGRLALAGRVVGERVITEWYAVWYRDGGKKRKSAKLGSYPTIPLAEARRMFREDFAPRISAGEDPNGPRARVDRRGKTVRDLFDAYAKTMEGRASHKAIACILLGPPDKDGNRTAGAAKAIGEHRLAAEVTAQDIIPHLAEIHGRGSVVQARTVHAYISAAFSWGMKSVNSYFGERGGVDWGIKANPAAAIPQDPAAFRSGSRFLTPAELRDFWNWLSGGETTSRTAPALKLIMVAGQRPGEILRIADATYDRSEQLVDWSKTKNGLPHTIPLPQIGCDILDALTPNEFGLYFPQRENPEEPMDSHAALHIIRRYCEETGAKAFVVRDLRRTWKTLAGKAGLSKDIRDRLQNHAKTDVSSKHYDRYDYLAEKRAAMKTWGEYLDRILSGEIDGGVVSIGDRAVA